MPTVAAVGRSGPSQRPVDRDGSDVDAWYDAALQMVAAFPEAGLALGSTLEARAASRADHERRAGTQPLRDVAVGG